MKLWVFALFLALSALSVKAQTGYNCQEAIPLTELNNFCSAASRYNNTNILQAGITWFKFTATETDVKISVTADITGTLLSPHIQLTDGCAAGIYVGLEQNSSTNVTTYYKGGLTAGKTYYIMVSGANGSTGQFKICINNFSSPVQAGQDAGTAVNLCNTTTTFRQDHVNWAGTNNNETVGTCLNGGETNSVWYKWRAANNGSLTFTITPDNTTDDIDFVLYDLGTSGDPANITPANAVRCAAGHGVDNSRCPTEALYYKTGLSMTETDLSEASGCGQGQNGYVRYLDAQEGHVYALLINNFSRNDAGLSMSFSDQNGAIGTAQFASPEAQVAVALADLCLVNRTYSVKLQTAGYTDVQWNFGQEATVIDVNAEGNYTVRYTTAGIKTITLTATNDIGCTASATQTIDIPLVLLPVKPVVSTNQNSYCVGDLITLTVDNAEPDVTYTWTGPNGFTAEGKSANIPVSDLSVAGSYTALGTRNGCTSELTTLVVDPVAERPVASFTTSPQATSTLLNAPVTITIQNTTTNADTYFWEFGDGSTSTLTNPTHEYTQPGSYYIKLTAFNNYGCIGSATKGQYIIDADNVVYIPNTFTPNGDGVNDLFGISLTNVNKYHLQIFTRWGELVYETRSVTQKWDGTKFGKQALPTGTYYYVINAVGVKANAIRRSGVIALIR